MNINEFAKMLDGREYRKEMTREEEKIAKDLGFVIVFGYSDDNTEFVGAIDDEVGCYEGREIYIDKDGIFDDCDCDNEDSCKYFKIAKEKAKVIKAIWDDNEGYCWKYETEIPHATFDIMDDGEKYCRGIVFDIKSLEG